VLAFLPWDPSQPPKDLVPFRRGIGRDTLGL
jgi:hypothetical protein